MQRSGRNGVITFFIKRGIEMKIRFGYVSHASPCLQLLKEIGRDVDFMIEAKAKDQALLKLVEEIGKLRGIKRVSGGAVEIK